MVYSAPGYHSHPGRGPPILGSSDHSFEISKPILQRARVSSSVVHWSSFNLPSGVDGTTNQKSTIENRQFKAPLRSWLCESLPLCHNAFPHLGQTQPMSEAIDGQK